MIDLIKLIKSCTEIYADDDGNITIDLADRGMLSCDVGTWLIECAYFDTDDPRSVVTSIREDMQWKTDRDTLISIAVDNLDIIEILEA